MSLQARAVNNENAGVTARGVKLGEAPSKQSGGIKRKGLSEMANNQVSGPRSLGGAVKLQVRPKFCFRRVLNHFAGPFYLCMSFLSLPPQ